jgi:alkanesulfonate monooxygenase SsuD/methylene tetrahydromethanopterin reductase-like flavin-dependent oxidoreductase (luciferase family)
MTMIACPGEATGPTREKELAAFRVTHREKVSRMEEGIEFLRQVSQGGFVNFEGTSFAIDDFELAPPFVQQPLPIWMTGNPPMDAAEEQVRRVLGRVARLGDGWLTFAVTPNELARRTRILGELRAPEGHDDFPVGVFLNVNVNVNADAALDDALTTWRGQSTRNVSSNDLRKVAAIGGPEQVADFIGQLRDAGATTIAMELLSSNRLQQVNDITELLLPLLG